MEKYTEEYNGPKGGIARGWINNSSYKSIWHYAEHLFKKYPSRDTFYIYKLMLPTVKKHWPKSRFNVRTLSWYRCKFNKGIHPRT